jgi:hypothetical protein
MLSIDENLEVLRGSAATRRKGAKALDRLRTVSERGDRDAAYVAALLGSVADAAERHSERATLPAAEAEIWTSVGAHFSTAATSRNDRLLADAFAALIADSIIGDLALAKALDVDRTRVSQRLAERSLYAFAAGDERCFPNWQFADGRSLPGLKRVLIAVDPGLHPLTVQHWFTTKNVDLEASGQPVSPATWLATGGSPDVAADLVAHL